MSIFEPNRLTSTGTIASRGFPEEETIPNYCSYFIQASPSCTIGIFALLEHHFKQTLCMHRAECKTINQVLDYLLDLIPV